MENVDARLLASDSRRTWVLRETGMKIANPDEGPGAY